VRELNDRIDAIVNKPPVIDEALKPSVGTFLMLDDQGRPKLDGAFYVRSAAGHRTTSIRKRRRAGTRRARKTRKSLGLSQRLVDELAVQRRDILAVHVAANPGLALDPRHLPDD
jgi:ParB family chromosome partitioning protein